MTAVKFRHGGRWCAGGGQVKVGTRMLRVVGSPSGARPNVTSAGPSSVPFGVQIESPYSMRTVLGSGARRIRSTKARSKWLPVGDTAESPDGWKRPPYLSSLTWTTRPSLGCRMSCSWDELPTSNARPDTEMGDRESSGVGRTTNHTRQLAHLHMGKGF